MGWKWWAKTYFTVLFSRDLWFSTFFIILEVLMVIGCFDSERFRRQPVLHVSMCLGSLFALAVTFTTLEIIQAYITHRGKEKFRLERERREQEFQGRIRRPVPIPEQPPEPEISPWLLGGWDKHLTKGE